MSGISFGSAGPGIKLGGSQSFGNPEFKKQEEIIARLKERNPDGSPKGAVVFDEKEGKVYIGNPYAERPAAVGIRTHATAQQIEQLRGSVSWMEETCQMLEAAAKQYNSRTMFIIVGPTSIGKTFVANVLTQAIYGSSAKALEISVAPNTDPDDFMVKFVPTTKPTSKFIIEQYQAARDSFEADKQREVDAAIKQTAPLAESVRFRILDAKFTKLFGVDASTAAEGAYKLEFGFIPKVLAGYFQPDGQVGFDLDHPGEGLIGVVNEVNRSKKIPQCFMALRGDQRTIAKRYLLEKADSRVISRGANAWFMFSVNPLKEGYEEVNPLDQALFRGLAVLHMPDLSEKSYLMACRDFLSFKRGGAPASDGRPLFKHWESRALLLEMSEILQAVHHQYKIEVDQLRRSREQKDAATLDDLGQFARNVYLYPHPDEQNRFVNMAETMRKAFKDVYLSRFDPTDSKEGKAHDRVADVIDNLLDGELGEKKFRGKVQKRSAVLKTLVEETAVDPATRNALAKAQFSATARAVLGDQALDPAFRRRVQDQLTAAGVKL